MERPFILSGGQGELKRRYSYVGAGPYLKVETKADGETFIDGKATTHKDPFLALQEILKGVKKGACASPAPFPFTGGAIGYFSYGLKNLIEDKTRLLRHFAPPQVARNDKAESNKEDNATTTPLSMVGLYDPVYVYDHKKEEGYIVWSGEAKTEGIFKEITERLSKADTFARPEFSVSADKSRPFYSSNITREEYLTTLDKATGDFEKPKIPSSVFVAYAIRSFAEENAV